MTKNYCTSLGGKSLTIPANEVAAYWFDKDSAHRIDGKLPAGRWTVESIGECGPGGEFLVVYQYSPFRMAYVPINSGMPFVS